MSYSHEEMCVVCDCECGIDNDGHDDHTDRLRMHAWWSEVTVGEWTVVWRKVVVFILIYIYVEVRQDALAESVFVCEWWSLCGSIRERQVHG